MWLGKRSLDKERPPWFRRGGGPRSHCLRPLPPAQRVGVVVGVGTGQGGKIKGVCQGHADRKRPQTPAAATAALAIDCALARREFGWVIGNFAPASKRRAPSITFNGEIYDWDVRGHLRAPRKWERRDRGFISTFNLAKVREAAGARATGYTQSAGGGREIAS